ncbi:hypothetical protein R1sor_001772 [Riccia sorocarpa]|uniref:Reverse transcriptase zinc-binding domain-containing protein n=1 Tax=Riccia sorocarpa TaxID=122646 RepID=A0ABD3H028_9MARC
MLPYLLNFLLGGESARVALAPLLFALSTIPFILAIQDKAKTGDLKQITLPGNVALDVCALADDTAVFLNRRKLPWEDHGPVVPNLGSLSSFQVLDGSRDSILLSKLLSIPSVPGEFHFQTQHWRLHPAQSKHAFPLSVSTAYATLATTYAPDWFQVLNSRWQVHWSRVEWASILSLIWGKGIPKREGIFLWRMLFMGFFTGQRAYKFGHPSSSCAACGIQEDIVHIFISCPAALRLWSTIRDNCVLMSTVLSDLLTSTSIPSALLQISNLRGGLKIASLLLLVHGFRACWRRRCAILFKGVTKSYTWVSVVISTIETLLAEAAVVSDK